MSHRKHKFSRQASVDEDSIPAINACFFYESAVAIDDPLSPVPPPQTSNHVSSRMTRRPFSSYDNLALNQAWNELREKLLRHCRSTHTSHKPFQCWKASLSNSHVRADLHVSSVNRSHSNSRQGSTSTESPVSSRSQSLARNSAEISRDTASKSRLNSIQHSPAFSMPIFRDIEHIEKGTSVGGLTARPFARLPSRKKLPTVALTVAADRQEQPPTDSEDGSKMQLRENAKSITNSRDLVDDLKPSAKVTVGMSRLHQVLMPELSMVPIYWSPVHDIATAIRGTWFYKDTMFPVDVDVANMLEAGYLELRPWTSTWQDELASAIEVGAIGEEKIVHRLWPEQLPKKTMSRPSSAMGPRSMPVPEDPEMFRNENLRPAHEAIDAASPEDKDFKAAGGTGTQGKGRKRYLDSGIIYASEREAYILRPNLQPSAYYGRRPLASYIRKGHDIGIAVVRGFDQSTWDRLNPLKRSKEASAAYKGASASDTGPGVFRRTKSDPTLSLSERPRVTDLILVIHGIGQKLSERVETFHFTHAMNAFRREVNVELGTSQVKDVLRNDSGGIMVLPVNWRSTLAYDEGGYQDEPTNSTVNQYSLLDITQQTLPSVRNIVSDVMLDIPYYLSHHQPKVIAAVIREANRIHKLWCLNNPAFESIGRVHVIAHSLGSVMAIDILSNQPTFVQPASDQDVESTSHFRFDVKNLYLAGSPAGIFLLLKNASLIPRKSRHKPSSDGDDLTWGIAGEAGTYGCIAVDNIYNIINPYDPVSYRLNASVDAAYSASLKQAIIPSATTSWFSLSNPFRAAPTATQLKKPGLLPRLPSSVELEIHNFTREEIAEKRFFLLNDNGQIDFSLRYGGGPLDIQYLTMLGAHSSYWITKDFIRFIVIETGRQPGRENTLETLRPVKRNSTVH